MLGSHPDSELPPGTITSIEANLAFLDDPETVKRDHVDGAIGELSGLHETLEYYAQGVSVTDEGARRGKEHVEDTSRSGRRPTLPVAG